MKNIVFIGYRCTGKTEVGRIVAHALGYSLMDTDELVEKDAGATITQIVSKRGWPRFRELEKKTIARVSKLSDSIIATGGGAVLDDENVANLRRNGIVFFLDATPAAIFGRMKNDGKTDTQRPRLTEKDALSEIEEVIAERAKRYVDSADYRIDTTDKEKKDVAQNILIVYRRIKGKR